MDVFEAMVKRHSYRGAFVAQAVPREDLRRIVQAGLLAPSGSNKQTTRFVIVDEPELVAQIAGMAGSGEAQRTAPAFVLCITDSDPLPQPDQMSFQVEDCAAATENMMLALTALGYASVWVDGWLRREGRAQAIGAVAGVPTGKVVRILMPVGVPVEARSQPEKLPFEERAWFGRYGG